MKRLSLLGFFGLMAGILAGCPIWSDEGNSGSQGCNNGSCTTGTQGGCTSSADCAENFTCGSDNQCHPGDCTDSGCSSGFTCVVDPSTQTASCQPSGTGGGGGGTTTGTGGSGTTGGMGGTGTGSTTGSGAAGGTGGAPTPVYCGHPADCASGYCATDGTCHAGSCTANSECVYGYTCQAGGCKTPTPGACDKDSDCAAGSVCIAGKNGKGGVCTQPANQCFDQSQCDPGDNCVAGKCTVSCSSDSDCRDGEACNTTLGVCSNAMKSCTITNDCGGASEVCVAGVCVPRSGPSGMCNAGDVWTENGCIPNQSATFTCQTDGTQDSCTSGSICLHHDCWISCDAPNQNACTTQIPQLSKCNPVTDAGNTYDVCGSATNLGQQCGQGAPAQTCTAAQICIDGFCK